MRLLLAFSLLVSICSIAPLCCGQDSSSPNPRKVVKQVMPRYPDLARRISLVGTVKLVAVVTTDGKVKKVETVGGSPILTQAAQDAVYQWRFAPASVESRETLELHFDPQAQQ